MQSTAEFLLLNWDHYWCDSTTEPNNVTQHWFYHFNVIWYIHTHNRFTALCPGLPRWGGTRRINHSGFCWSRHDGVAVALLNHMQAICTLLQKITTPAPHHSDFYGPDALPDTQPTASKNWRYPHQTGSINTLCWCYSQQVIHTVNTWTERNSKSTDRQTNGQTCRWTENSKGKRKGKMIYIAPLYYE